MKLLIFGGSFNPLHIGHLFIAEEARNTLGYEMVVFVPSNISSHKADDTGLDPELRYEMLCKALEDEDGFKVDKCDIISGGISYSINTVNHIYENYDFEGKPGFIIGDDLLAGFKTWKKVPELLDKIDLVVVKRDFQNKLTSEYPDYYINNTILPLSSTEIRRRIREKKTIKYLVPEKIRQIIENNGYYR